MCNAIAFADRTKEEGHLIHLIKRPVILLERVLPLISSIPFNRQTPSNRHSCQRDPSSYAFSKKVQELRGDQRKLRNCIPENTGTFHPKNR
jgi:hypothetical protein